MATPKRHKSDPDAPRFRDSGNAVPDDRVIDLHARQPRRERSTDDRISISQERLDILDARLERLTAIQQSNVDQIARLTESQMLANQRLEKLTDIAERQERHIDRLLGIVEHLIQERSNSDKD